MLVGEPRSQYRDGEDVVTSSGNVLLFVSNWENSGEDESDGRNDDCGVLVEYGVHVR